MSSHMSSNNCVRGMMYQLWYQDTGSDHNVFQLGTDIVRW